MDKETKVKLRLAKVKDDIKKIEKLPVGDDKEQKIIKEAKNDNPRKN